MRCLDAVAWRFCLIGGAHGHTRGVAAWDKVLRFGFYACLLRSAVDGVVADLADPDAALEPARLYAAGVEEQRPVGRVGDGAGQHGLRGGKGSVAVGANRKGLRAAVAAVGELAAFGHHRAGRLGKFAALGAVQYDIGNRGSTLGGLAAGLVVDRLGEAGEGALGRRIPGGGECCSCE